MVRVARRSADCILFCLGRPWRGWGSGHVFSQHSSGAGDMVGGAESPQRILVAQAPTTAGYSSTTTGYAAPRSRSHKCGGRIFSPAPSRHVGDGRSGMAAQLDLGGGEDEIWPSPSGPPIHPRRICACPYERQAVRAATRALAEGRDGGDRYRRRKSERQQPGEEPATAYVLDVNRILIWSKIKARLCHLPVP